MPSAPLHCPTAEPRIDRLVILANSDAEDTPYHLWCRDAADSVLLITGPDLADGYRDHLPTLAIPDFSQSPAVLAAADDFLGGGDRSSRILCRGEYDVLRAAELRERHGLAGPGPDDCRAFRDKHLMKAHVAASTVRTPRSQLIHTLADARDFLERERKIVLKPLDGSGAVGTHVIDSDAALLRLWEDGIAPPVLAEEFIPGGRMIHVDGLLDEGGDMLFTHVSRYFNDCLAWRAQLPVGSISLGPDHPLHAPAEAALGAVLRHLPDPGATAFHAEFFVTGTHELVFCEIACRSPGARIVQQIAHETGVDLDLLWCLQQLGRTRAARDMLRRAPAARAHDARLCAHLLIPPGRGLLAHRALPALPQWVIAAWDRARVGQTYPGAVKSGDWLSSYIVEGENDAMLEARLVELVALDAAATTWAGDAAA